NYPRAVVTRRVVLDNLGRTESILPCLNHSRPTGIVVGRIPKPTAWRAPDESVASPLIPRFPTSWTHRSFDAKCQLRTLVGADKFAPHAPMLDNTIVSSGSQSETRSATKMDSSGRKEAPDAQYPEDSRHAYWEYEEGWQRRRKMIGFDRYLHRCVRGGGGGRTKLEINPNGPTVTQIETLRRLRNGGSQVVRVEHVHVNEGGQAAIKWIVQVYPKDLRALPDHPEPAVSWSGVARLSSKDRRRRTTEA